MHPDPVAAKSNGDEHECHHRQDQLVHRFRWLRNRLATPVIRNRRRFWSGFPHGLSPRSLDVGALGPVRRRHGRGRQQGWRSGRNKLRRRNNLRWRSKLWWRSKLRRRWCRHLRRSGGTRRRGRRWRNRVRARRRRHKFRLRWRRRVHQLRPEAVDFFILDWRRSRWRWRGRRDRLGAAPAAERVEAIRTTVAVRTRSSADCAALCRRPRFSSRRRCGRCDELPSAAFTVLVWCVRFRLTFDAAHETPPCAPSGVPGNGWQATCQSSG